MWDYTIHNLYVQDMETVDANLQPVIRKRVIYNVGKQGPFVLIYNAKDYSAAQLQADIDKEVATLRALHDSTQQAR